MYAFSNARRIENTRELENLPELYQTKWIKFGLQKDNWRIIKEIDYKSSYNNRKNW